MHSSFDASAALDDHGGGLSAWICFALFAIVCGLVYPAVSVGLSGMLFPNHATGSLILQDGQAVGSELVGQPFSSPGYLHGRPSAAGYDPTNVSGSNLAPSNPALRQRALRDAEAVAARDAIAPGRIPVDLLTASGSGIDPHVSPQAAAVQAPRIAAARGLDIEAVNAVIRAHTEGAQLGLLGQPRVNVLAVNLELDAMPAAQP